MGPELRQRHGTQLPPRPPHLHVAQFVQLLVAALLWSHFHDLLEPVPRILFDRLCDDSDNEESPS